MNHFEIVAHRGIPIEAPENTIASFQRAIDLCADAIEFDVRLTSDQIPIVYHYFQLDKFTSATGMIFDFPLEQLQEVRVFCKIIHVQNLAGFQRLKKFSKCLADRLV